MQLFRLLELYLREMCIRDRNMFSHGVDPGLDFSNMMQIRETYERLTRMHVNERQPYAGDLVFTAFSGSHQDAIAKGMAWRDEKDCDKWTVPYLPIDPKDVGRTYDKDVIRINSQSGKGGVNYILKQSYGISLPEKMREEVGYLVKDVSDKAHKELTPDWVYHIFEDNYVNYKGVFTIEECHFKQDDGILASATICHGNGKRIITASGNGRLDAVSLSLIHICLLCQRQKSGSGPKDHVQDPDLCLFPKHLFFPKDVYKRQPLTQRNQTVLYSH